MADKNINLDEYVDQRRWLLNNGLITDDVKNQLFFCGSIVHKEVQAVELDLIADEKKVNYKIYVDKNLLKKIQKYKDLSKSNSLIGMWLFKRFLKKEGSLDFQQVLNKFVTDFCGPKWYATVEVVDFDTYIENEVQGEDHRDRQSNK
jgi:hypothetical protein